MMSFCPRPECQSAGECVHRDERGFYCILDGVPETHYGENGGIIVPEPAATEFREWWEKGNEKSSISPPQG